MKHRCPPEAELAGILELPPDDPRRREHEDCARCSALLCALGSFLHDGVDLDETGAAELERRLDLAIGIETQEGGRVRSARSGQRWRQRPRALRWGVAVTAMAAVVATMMVLREPPGRVDSPSGRLRQATTSGADAAAGAWSLQIDRVRHELSWPAVEGADSYVVELFTAELDTFAVIDSLTRTSLSLSDALVARAHPAGDLLVRVRAVHGDTSLATTELKSIRLD